MSLKRTVTVVIKCDGRRCRTRLQVSSSDARVRLTETLWLAAQAEGWTRAFDGTHRCARCSAAAAQPATQAG